ncbi:hypothetical protein OMO38_07330 [Chryseobacterium sp. 09-1422]|uniref:Flagella basal body P-ring formation protein FlgA n=1 Tax=Chryseobacterium kimseyorum TaxID=2984028 RepID=A0ABT3HXA9_9FLAO|nr:hypothetical protein [Chryseobacterium kimseyorum]MCW3168335.1 hypothetical protein [Chryseobacterium kimseyorum]
MKKLLLFFVILLNGLISAQIKNIYTGKVDSIVIRNYSYYDKETSTVNDTNESNSIQLLNSKKLVGKQIVLLNALLKSKKSYLPERALLSHFNKKIEYFLNGVKIQDITISTMTKNITIYNREKLIYKAKMSSFLEKGILNIEK